MALHYRWCSSREWRSIFPILPLQRRSNRGFTDGYSIYSSCCVEIAKTIRFSYTIILSCPRVQFILALDPRCRANQKHSKSIFFVFEIFLSIDIKTMILVPTNFGTKYPQIKKIADSKSKMPVIVEHCLRVKTVWFNLIISRAIKSCLLIPRANVKHRASQLIWSADHYAYSDISVNPEKEDKSPLQKNMIGVWRSKKRDFTSESPQLIKWKVSIAEWPANWQ